MSSELGSSSFAKFTILTFGDRTFIIAAICGVVGIFVTYFFVEDLSGEDLTIRDARFRTYLVEHGWDGEMGEDDLKGLADEGQVPGERIMVGQDNSVNEKK